MRNVQDTYIDKMMKSNRLQAHRGGKELSISSYDQALKRLSRAIALSQGQFSLILVCCNDAPLQAQVVKQVTDQFSGNIQNLAIDPSLNKLYTAIKKTIRKQEPEALMVFGLDSVYEIDRLLTSSNLVRGQFCKCFSFPLILWVNDEIIKKLVRLAPDFKNWATTIRFTMPQNSREELAPYNKRTINDIRSYQLPQVVNG